MSPVSSLTARAAEVLELPRWTSAAGSGSDPEPVARHRLGDLGAVLFALRLRGGEHGVLSGLFERDSGSGEWAELALDGNPWFDEGFVPAPYAPGEPLADCVAVSGGDGVLAVMRVAGRVVEGVEELHVRAGDRDIACELGTGGAFIALMVIDPGSPPPPLLVRRGALEERVETGR